jgi:leader peptidase (prepilin peptidase)/N-methyltransferase
MQNYYLVEILAFIFGSCVGSFLNVCIYRLPASKSIVRPASACPKCNHEIRFYDNVPILSYLILGGRCRNCSTHIPIRYPLVELMGGVFALLCLMKFGPGIQALIYFVFITVLLVITFIDIDHRIIPDVLSLPGIPLFFLGSFGVADVTWVDSLMGILVGGGILFLVAWVYYLFTHREGMGGGDIKLLAMIGALIGWKGILFTVFASSAIGTVAGILTMLHAKKGMKLAVPFGPFLSIGAILYLFFGNQIIDWYFNLIR